MDHEIAPDLLRVEQPDVQQRRTREEKSLSADNYQAFWGNLFANATPLRSSVAGSKSAMTDNDDSESAVRS